MSHYNSSAGSPTVKAQHLQTARSLFTEAAEKNHLDATKLLAGMWEKGEGGPQDYKKAEEFYLKAKNLGDRTVAYQLELLYKKTNQVDKRFKLYKELAEAGTSAAQVALGNLYMEGKASDEDKMGADDIDLAIEWYKKAASQGDIKGEYGLGSAYFKKKNYYVASRYFEKIINNPNAERILGKTKCAEVLHALGNIYAKSERTAHKAKRLYKDSIALGNKNAQEMLDAVSNKLPNSKRDEYGEKYQPLLWE